MELEWLKRFAIEYCCLFSSSSVPSFHLPTQPVHLLLCAYKREVAPLQSNTHNTHASASWFQSFAPPPIRSSPFRLAACTTGRDSRPPELRFSRSCTGEER